MSARLGKNKKSLINMYQASERVRIMETECLLEIPWLERTVTLNGINLECNGDCKTCWNTLAREEVWE